MILSQEKLTLKVISIILLLIKAFLFIQNLLASYSAKESLYVACFTALLDHQLLQAEHTEISYRIYQIKYILNDL